MKRPREHAATPDRYVPTLREDGDGRLARLAAGTTALTFVLVLLGVWTAIAGYGLTCDGRWPLCDGFLGLFPRNFGSFVEWFHRLVAMIAGFAILGTAAASWRADVPRRIRAAFTAAIVLTPVQVVLGGLTVLEYERVILAAHFGTAIAILALLVAGTVWLTGRPLPAEDLGALAAGTLLGGLALTPGVVVRVQSIAHHVAYYALVLGALVALLAIALAPAERDRALRALAGVGALVVATGTTVGRISFQPGARTVVAACLAAGLLVAVATVLCEHFDLLGPGDAAGP